MKDENGEREPRIEDFLDAPTRRLQDWHWLWTHDVPFPVRTHRGPIGLVAVWAKRLLAPIFSAPIKELWDRQRVFNLILLEHLDGLDARIANVHTRLDHLLALEARVSHFEAKLQDGLTDVMRHDDALFSRVDAELDRQGRRVRELLGELRAALAAVAASGGTPAGGSSPLASWVEQEGYVELEARYRGTEEEIAERVRVWCSHLLGHEPVLDLGCGRGEVLGVLREAGISARGVDSSDRMVAICRDKGLAAETGDMFAALAATEPQSLGGVTCLHVVEHLPAGSLPGLASLAFRALRPGGMLIVETPNPLSLLVTGQSFWLDPTHQRPVHPEYLAHCCRLAGFDQVEKVELRPYPLAQRLPELDLTELPPDQHHLADRVNRLRDRIDELLFGFQDYAVVATKASAD